LPGSEAGLEIRPGKPERLFQSTPPVAGERSNTRESPRCSTSRFNPRPPLPGSEARIEVGFTAFDAVSIHAPRCRGAKPARCSLAALSSARFNPRPPLPGSEARVALGWRALASRFNPRPPLPGSEAGRQFEMSGLADVSIHAPRCRGAKPETTPRRSRLSLFQSTPPVAGERSSA